MYNISIHAPRERSDPEDIRFILRSDIISIHAPRERSDKTDAPFVADKLISIHAPRERSDANSTQ